MRCATDNAEDLFWQARAALRGVTALLLSGLKGPPELNDMHMVDPENLLQLLELVADKLDEGFEKLDAEQSAARG